MTFSATFHAHDVAQVANDAFKGGGIGLAVGVDDDLEVQGLFVGDVALLSDAADFGHDARGLVEVGEELSIDLGPGRVGKGEVTAGCPLDALAKGCIPPRSGRA